MQAINIWIGWRSDMTARPLCPWSEMVPLHPDVGGQVGWGQVNITIEGENHNGYDEIWLWNAVEEPLEETEVDRKQV